MTFVKAIWNEQSGAAAAEYALILAIVGTGIALAAFTLGGAIKNSIYTASNCVANAQLANC